MIIFLCFFMVVAELCISLGKTLSDARSLPAEVCCLSQNSAVKTPEYLDIREAAWISWLNDFSGLKVLSEYSIAMSHSPVVATFHILCVHTAWDITAVLIGRSTDSG